MTRAKLKQTIDPYPKPKIDIISACRDPKLFGPWFKNEESWQAWFSFLRAVFCLEMPKQDFDIYRQCTKRDTVPQRRISECYMPIGRRGGKSLITSMIAVYLSCFFDWRPYLAPGERGTVGLFAADRKQARVLFRYIGGFLKGIRLLKSMIERETKEIFELKNQVNIEIFTSSFRTLRGYTFIATLLDEIAYWPCEDSANPDYEILAAIRPGMATIPGSMIFALSSPYSQRGVLYDMYKKYYGQNDDMILIWQAPTWVMNPTVPQEVIDEAYKRDPIAAAAEYGAQFRKDVQQPFDPDIVDDCTDVGIYERSYEPEHDYIAFVDPSGGSQDAMTLAIAHTEKETRVLDAVRVVKPPFSPDSVIQEFVAVAKSYGIEKVIGDRYGGQWPQARFQAFGMEYEVCARAKTSIYSELLPLINSKKVRLLDHKELRNELVSLERKTTKNGRDYYDHPPGGHDDIINAAAGAVTYLEAEAPAEVW